MSNAALKQPTVALKQYFKLYPSCIPVKGYFRGLIADLQRGKYHIVPLSLIDLLDELKAADMDTIREEYAEDREMLEEYYDYLMQLKVGQVANEQPVFGALSEVFAEPNTISHAVLEVSDSCTIDYDEVIRQLDSLGCKYLQIVGFEKLRSGTISNLVDSCNATRFLGVNLLLKYSSRLETENYRKKFQKTPVLGEVVFHSAPSSEVQRKGFFRVLEETASFEQCGTVSPSYFSTCIPFYTEGLCHNTCLNRKVFIGRDGGIRNCPAMPTNFGKVQEAGLKQAITSEGFKKYWYIPKDKVDVCKDCEFRHLCQDCRVFIKDPSNAYSQPSKCPYNPYIAKFEWDEGYVPVEECGTYTPTTGFVVNQERVEELNEQLWGG